MVNNKKRRVKKSTGKKYFVLRGNAQLSGAVTNTSAAGAFVITRYEVDTLLCLSWQQAGQLFARWRVKRLKFEFRAIKGMTTDGNVGIVFLPDTNMTTPTTTANALSNEKSAFGHIFQNVQLTVRPKHEGWLFTRDAVASTDDRLEMPGDVCIFTENCSSAFAPGIFMMHYEVEFDQVSNSVVAPEYVTPVKEILQDGKSVLNTRHGLSRSKIVDKDLLRIADSTGVTPGSRGLKEEEDTPSTSVNFTEFTEEDMKLAQRIRAIRLAKQ